MRLIRLDVLSDERGTVTRIEEHHEEKWDGIQDRNDSHSPTKDGDQSHHFFLAVPNGRRNLQRKSKPRSGEAGWRGWRTMEWSGRTCRLTLTRDCRHSEGVVRTKAAIKSCSKDVRKFRSTGSGAAFPLEEIADGNVGLGRRVDPFSTKLN